MPTVEISGDVKSGLGLRGAGIVEDFLVRIQWFASRVMSHRRTNATAPALDSTGLARSVPYKNCYARDEHGTRSWYKNSTAQR